jgi:aerobic carbon-monoxide dehydrogenase small subunit
MSESRARGRKCEVSFIVNSRAISLEVYAMERLLDVLRHELGLTGAKEGCGEGECGSCAVLVDGTLVNSCLIPALQADGAKIVTIEGLPRDGCSEALREAFLRCGGAQCGICTPGMILAAFHLLSKKPEPTVEEIREGLAGNLCRCTGYAQIIEAVAEAGRRGAAG